MSRLMSVSLTEAAVVARTKTVTRRLGWRELEPGDRLTLCRKVMGRKKGEPLVRLAEIQVVSVRREPLNDVTDAEVLLEGFGDLWRDGLGSPGWAAVQFVEFFHKQMRCPRDAEVTRIEWRYLDEVSS